MISYLHISYYRFCVWGLAQNLGVLHGLFFENFSVLSERNEGFPYGSGQIAGTT